MQEGGGGFRIWGGGSRKSRKSPKEGVWRSEIDRYNYYNPYNIYN